jgi:hypothetical protein
MNPRRAYGTTRARRPDVSYGQIEAAAQAILATGIRPTVEGVREALKAGSQRTLLNGLQRFWQELGGRLSGAPDSRRRLPAVVADIADNLWQTALALATDAAEGSDAAIKAQLAQLRTDTEVRGHALAQREIEMESLVRSRERTIRELEEHLRATMVLVNKRDTTIRSLEARMAAALSETESYRQRLTAVVARAVSRHRATAPAGSRRRPAKSFARQRRESPRRPQPRSSATPKQRAKSQVPRKGHRRGGTMTPRKKRPNA